jgi:hypothetical protein
MMKVIVSLFFRYDELRRPRWGFLCGGSVTVQNLPARRASQEALRRGSIAEKTDFHDLGVNAIGSSPFLPD